MSREAMKLALKALEANLGNWAAKTKAVEVLRQALVDADDTSENHVDETVKRRHEWFDCTDEQLIEEVRRRGFVIRDAQIEVPKREWVGLTDEEQIQVAWSCGAMSADWLEFAKAIEAKLKEKNKW